MTTHGVGDEWRIPDDMWPIIEALLPPEKPKHKGGRPRMDNRKAMDAIFYILRTGIQWKALPRELGAPSTVHDRFKAWTALGIFEELWTQALLIYDEEQGLNWQWQAADGVMTKAPLGGKKTGRNPTDRGKIGTKRSLLTDGSGIPVGLAGAGAHRHDSLLLEETIEDMVDKGICPQPTRAQPQHMCLDAAYVGQPIKMLLERYEYIAHIRSRKDEMKAKMEVPKYRARRWVVERSHSWMNRFRRILIRWEKDPDLYKAMLHLAMSVIILQRTSVFG